MPARTSRVFLTAQPEARARRRYDELLARGQQADYVQVLQDVMDRDWRDTHRETAPLRKAEDAVELDTTYLSLEESWERLYHLTKERLSL